MVFPKSQIVIARVALAVLLLVSCGATLQAQPAVERPLLPFEDGSGDEYYGFEVEGDRLRIDFTVNFRQTQANHEGQVLQVAIYEGQEEVSTAGP